MAVMIEDMVLPKSCIKCQFCKYQDTQMSNGYYICKLMDAHIFNVYRKPKWCMLKPVKKEKSE